MDAVVPAARPDLARTIAAYDDPLVKAYCWGRFKVLRQPFLDEIGQYLPPAGRVVDIGCGFGLFSLYYAQKYPSLEILGIDLNPRRIELATRTAAELGVRNVRYEVGDAAALSLGSCVDGVYVLDVMHHMPAAALPPLVRHLHQHLRPGGRLIVKDVDTTPAYKRWFTFVLDKLIDPRSPVHYWPREELQRTLSAAGFDVFYHSMPDVLPYPHMLYICHKAR